MIKYEKANLDYDVIRLLKKLSAEFPLPSLIKEIENFGCTVNKVFYDNKLYGVLVCRAFISHKGLKCLVIDHAIAEDNIEQSLTSILAESLEQWATDAGFDVLSQHAHRPGLARILSKFYGEPKEWIFKKELKCQKANQVRNRHNQPAHNQRTRE